VLTNEVVMVPRLNAAATVAKAVPVFSMTLPVLSTTSPGKSRQVLRNKAAFNAMTKTIIIHRVALGQFIGSLASGGAEVCSGSSAMAPD